MNKYFINDVTAKIFFLVELQGKQQLDFLGIDYEYYCDRKLAKAWYEKTKGELEASKHPNVKIAMESLNKIYKGMGGKI